jgi:hypothetical protein
LLASSANLLGLVDKTSQSSSWAQYYGSGLSFKDAFVRKGSTFTLTWQVVDGSGFALANQSVQLLLDKGFGQSNAVFQSGAVTAINTGTGVDGGHVSATTDASGLVSFSVTDLTPTSEPANTSVTEIDTNAVKWYGQFALKIGTTDQLHSTLDIVDIHILARPTGAANLMWSEDFTGDTGTLPSASNWTSLLGDGFSQLGFYNYGTGEIESNTPENGKLDGAGNLAIVARYSAGTWTSDRIWTQGKVGFKYGKVEARIKMPSGNFNWPAFWMLGTNYLFPNNLAGSVPWPNSGEIDIVELMQSNSVLQSTLHGNDPGTNNDWNGGAGVTRIHPSVTASELTSDFHNYGILWETNTITFTLDGNEIVTNSLIGNFIIQSIGGSEISRFNSGGSWPFNAPFFLILNNAIPSGTPAPIEGTSSTMLIDWIHYSTHNGSGLLTSG